MGSLNGMDDGQVSPLLGGQVILPVRVHCKNFLPGEVMDKLGDVRDQRLGALGAEDTENKIVLYVDDNQQVAFRRVQTRKIHKNSSFHSEKYMFYIPNILCT